jgi:FkbM family methyltransferase
MSLFNNCNPHTNGELLFVRSLPPGFVVFDVGSRVDSEFSEYVGEVHYFDPNPAFIETLRTVKTNNTASFYNPVGLSTVRGTLDYYPLFQSFHNRVVSCKKDDTANKISFSTIRADEYIAEHNITHIDLVKIDTEGHELEVLKGFGEALRIVDCVQFEYGGTFLDTGVKLRDVISYLEGYGFKSFKYLSQKGPVPITDFSDHYQYCNILCTK